MDKSKRYDFIKIVTMVLVVIAHVTRMYTGKGVVVPANSSSFLNYVTDFIYGFHMPLFILISGAVYHLCIYDLHKYNIKKAFLINKFKRLIIPYFIFGLFYVTPVMILFKFTDDSLVSYVIKNIFLCVDSRHLWFLYYLFIYFILYYFIFKNKDNLKFLSLLFIIYLVIYLLNIPIISNLSCYAIYFNFGFALNKYYQKYYSFVRKFKYLIIPLIIGYSFLIYFSTNNLINNMTGIIVFLTLFLFVSVPPKIINSIYYEKLRKYSMGIYLFHPMIIYVLFYYLGKYNINPIILSLFIFIICFSVSWILTALIKRTRFKFIFGE